MLTRFTCQAKGSHAPRPTFQEPHGCGTHDAAHSARAATLAPSSPVSDLGSIVAPAARPRRSEGYDLVVTRLPVSRWPRARITDLESRTGVFDEFRIVKKKQGMGYTYEAVQLVVPGDNIVHLAWVLCGFDTLREAVLLCESIGHTHGSTAIFTRRCVSLASSPGTGDGNIPGIASRHFSSP